MMKIKGLHHMSAITADAKENLHFYTEILGMRLVKKTVNQDAPSMYHLFYADEKGNPGTDVTFFEMRGAGQVQKGTNSISATSLRVPNDKALDYWKDRFNEFQVPYEDARLQAGRMIVPFTDFEGQRLVLISDEHNTGVAGGVPWDKSPVPMEFAIVGLGPSRFTVEDAEGTAALLTNILGFREKERYASETEGQPDIIIYETAEGGTGAEIHLEHRVDLEREQQGRGSVHHIALRVEDKEELDKAIEKLDEHGISNSQYVDRYYFQSVYIKDPNGLTIELATDGPGFDTDEELEHLGESLALPPFLEHHREEIESGLEPL